MRRGEIFGGAVLVALVAASPAYSQSAKRFQAQLSARAEHDDNVSRSSAGVAALRNLEQEDTIFSPALTLDVIQPVGRQAVFLNGVVGYKFYDKNDQLNRERVALRGGVNTSLGPCAGVVSGSFSRQQSELDDLALNVTKNVETTTSVGVDATCGREVGLAPTFSVVQRWAENSAADRAGAEYVELNATAGLAYRRPTFGELSVFGQYGKTEYEDRLIPAGASVEEDGFERYGAGIRYTRKLGARIQGTANAGYSVVRPVSNVTEDFEGFEYGLDVSFRPSSRLDTSATFARAVNPSNRIQSTYSVSDTFAVRASYRLGSRLVFGLGGSYSEKSYEGPALVSGLSVTEDQMKTFNASVAFNFSRRLSVTLDASQQERDANVPGVDYTSNRIGLSVVATY